MTSTNSTPTSTDSFVIGRHNRSVTNTEKTSTYIPTGEEFLKLSADEQKKCATRSFALFSSEPDFLNE